MKVNLFYLSGNTTGGWVTYTAHLKPTLESQGFKVKMYKITKKTERTERSFGYDLTYQNVNREDAVKVEGINLIVALQKNYLDIAIELLKRGAFMVIHDPTEMRNTEFAQTVLDNGNRTIVIRKGNKKYIPGSTFIQHPYVRFYNDKSIPSGEWNAVAISRIDFDKNTDWLLEANRLLKPEKKIKIYGFENRIYTRFNILPKYPEWVQSVVHYPRELRYATKLCDKARFMVDMSYIKGDGGGTQYTFLEAMDAGAIVVINKGWLDNAKSPVLFDGTNCIAVANVDDLVEVLEWDDEYYHDYCDFIGIEARKLLKHHAPKIVGPKYKKFLTS
jgi:glycosyltransferase involved in cell wall biosynthesis